MRLVPYGRQTLDQLRCRIGQQRCRVGAEDQHRRGHDCGARNLMRPARLLPPLAKNDGRVVGVAREQTRERPRGIELRPRGHGAVLEAVDALARHLIRIAARLAGRLVCAVKVDHQLIFRRVLQNRAIQLDHFLRFVIEEVDLHTYDARIVETREQSTPLGRIVQRVAVAPEPDADVAGFRILDQIG